MKRRDHVNSSRCPHTMLGVWLTVLSGIAACHGKQECERTADCKSGYACIDKTCRMPCLVQGNCADTQVCRAGFCAPRAGSALPEITAVTGNQVDNPQRVADGLLVSGSLLGNATFELRSDAQAVPLTLRSQSENSAEAVLPTDVRQGLHTLAATNAAGTTEVSVTLELPDLSGDLLVARINAQTTTKLTPGVMPDEILARLAALEDKSCPAGYAHDTTRADIMLCKRGADEMVKVGDFWVDRYEGVVVNAAFYDSGQCDGVCTEGTTCFGATGGAAPTDNYPSTFPHNGNVTSKDNLLYACSVRGVTPSRLMTWFQAAQACAASGKHLITNAEWQTAAAGTFDPGVWDGSAGGVAKCNTNAAAHPGPRLTGSAGTTPAGSDSCISVHGAEDMVGNLWEWTSDWLQAGEPYNGTPTNWVDATLDSSHWPDSSYGDDGSWNLAGRATNGSTWVNGVPAVMKRGGASDNGTGSGVFAVNLNNAPSNATSLTGLRCARR